MEYLGSNFSITLGSWRLRIGFALEEAQDEMAVRAPVRAHHVVYPRDFSKVR